MTAADPDPAPRTRPRLRVAVCDARGRPAAALARGLGSWLARTAPASAQGSVTLALVGNARMRALNVAYRGKDYATDVLSFPAARELKKTSRGTGESGPKKFPSPAGRGVRGEGGHLGDVVIATGVAARQAKEAGHSVATELRVLALHGLLHLLGYDHERDRGEMARVERRLRRRGGLREGLIERAI
jgi:probable rRNA maturation factor